MNDSTNKNMSQKSEAEVSELRRFASLFTKDWSAHSATIFALAGDYIRGLPPERKEILSREYHSFLYESGADSDEALLQLWYAQGAEEWDPDLMVRPVMEDFYYFMNPKAPEFAELASDREADPAAKSRGFTLVGVMPRRQQD